MQSCPLLHIFHPCRTTGRYQEDFWRPRSREDGPHTTTCPENDDGHDGRQINGQIQDALRKDQLQQSGIGGCIHPRPPSADSLQGLLPDLATIGIGQLEDSLAQSGPPPSGICQTETVNLSNLNENASDTDPSHHPHSRHLCTHGH